MESDETLWPRHSEGITYLVNPAPGRVSDKKEKKQTDEDEGVRFKSVQKETDGTLAWKSSTRCNTGISDVHNPSFIKSDLSRNYFLGFLFSIALFPEAFFFFFRESGRMHDVNPKLFLVRDLWIFFPFILTAGVIWSQTGEDTVHANKTKVTR